MVTAALVRRAAGEVYGRRFMPLWMGWALGALVLTAAAVSLLSASHWWRQQTSALSTANVVSHTATPAAEVPAVSGGISKASTSINDLLAANSGKTSDAVAYRRLLSLWGAAMGDDRDPCGQAQKAGLACLDQRGSWAQVRALNRPAILTLTDDRGQKHRVVLSALDDSMATLNLGEHNERIPIEELSRDWFGDFTVVWKPKTPRIRPLSLGMHGDEVRWLRRSLNALHGAASDPEHGDVYDEELVLAVQNFQREHRLNVDGIAGLQTQVVLDTALADPGTPLLQQNPPHG